MDGQTDSNNTVKCKTCGYELAIGDFPFCQGKQSDHIGHTSRSGEIQAIVYHQNPSTGEISFPGHGDDPVDQGYVRKEIKSIREYEKFRRDWNAIEREQTQGRIVAEKAFHDQRIKERREEVIAKLGGRPSLLFDLARKYADAKRERIYQQRMRGDPACHSRIIEFDGNSQRITPKVRD